MLPSSELSRQSCEPSQTNSTFIHSSLSHCHSFGPQVSLGASEASLVTHGDSELDNKINNIKNKNTTNKHKITKQIKNFKNNENKDKTVLGAFQVSKSASEKVKLC